MTAELTQNPRPDSLHLLHEAERWFGTFTTEPGNRELSLEVIAQVKESIAPDQSADYAQRLAVFVAEHRAQIDTALREYGAGSPFEGEFTYVLFTQPESLILWERIQNALLALTETFFGASPRLQSGDSRSRLFGFV